MSLGLTLACAVLRRQLRRGLDGLWASGLDPTRARLAQGPVIFAATHVSWWDGPAMLLLDRALGIEGRFLMDRGGLARVPYARHLGAIPIDRGSGAAARRGLRRAARALQGPGDAVWIFPQGRQRPAWLRPLGLQRGVEVLQRISGATVIPVALQIGFREDRRPAMAARFAPALGRQGPLLQSLEASLIEHLALTDRWLDGGPGQGLIPVIRPAGTPDRGSPTGASARPGYPAVGRESWLTWW